LTGTIHGDSTSPSYRRDRVTMRWKQRLTEVTVDLRYTDATTARGTRIDTEHDCTSHMSVIIDVNGPKNFCDSERVGQSGSCDLPPDYVDQNCFRY
jgi:hypothetical protein